MRRRSPETRAAAVAMYAAGKPSHVVGERFHVSPSTVVNWVRAAGVEVRPIGRTVASDDPESPQVLTGGRWVLRGGIQRWQADPEPVEAVEPTPLKPRPANGDLIACPTCGARITERCRSASGRRADVEHANRILPRRCACGGLPVSSSPYCRECRHEVALGTHGWRESRYKAEAVAS